MTNLKEVILEAGGAVSVAAACKVSPRAVYKWLDSGRLPRTEYSGETRYAELIADLIRERHGSSFTGEELLIQLRPGAQATADADAQRL